MKYLILKTLNIGLHHIKTLLWGSSLISLVYLRKMNISSRSGWFNWKALVCVHCICWERSSPYHIFFLESTLSNSRLLSILSLNQINIWIGVTDAWKFHLIFSIFFRHLGYLILHFLHWLIKIFRFLPIRWKLVLISIWPTSFRINVCFDISQRLLRAKSLLRWCKLVWIHFKWKSRLLRVHTFII